MPKLRRRRNFKRNNPEQAQSPKRVYSHNGLTVHILNAFRVFFAAVLRMIAVPFNALANLFSPSSSAQTKEARAKRSASAPAQKRGSVQAPSTEATSPLSPAPPVHKHTRTFDLLLLGACCACVLFLATVLLIGDGTKLISFYDGETTRSIQTKAKTVGELFDLHGIAVKDADIVNYALEDPIEDDMLIEVSYAFPVAVASGASVDILYMQGGSVGEALTCAGIEYDSDDELTHLPFEDLTPGMHVQHIDVKISYETQDEDVEFKEETIKDDTRYIGNDKIRVEGQNGERRTVRKYVYKDGKLSSRDIMDQIMLKEPVKQVKIVGTKIRYQTNFTGDDRLWKPKPTKAQTKSSMTVSEITAYTHTGRRTATGKRTRIGRVAVNPKVIPYGTKLYIPGYGYCIAEDTGAFRNEQGGMKNQIDIFLNTEQECLKWGRKRNVRVYILTGDVVIFE
ncbi:G5 domain-containing protein [Christensenellaceae bacterium OttesenSCG-928-M15]|nr:G5 domain-containing protein [Christensenellaceae bacterium OttesenSCG-928-M15]